MSQGASPPGGQRLPGLSPAQRDAMRALGRDWARDIQGNRKQVCEIYDAVHAALPADGVRRVDGLAYGGDPRQLLDLYLPPDATPASTLPVVVFVHGGAFLRGNKDASPYIYANVPRLFARLGYVGVNLEYRLAPRAPIPPARRMWWRRWHGCARRWAPTAVTRGVSCSSAIRPAAATWPAH